MFLLDFQKNGTLTHGKTLTFEKWEIVFVKNGKLTHGKHIILENIEN